MRQLPGSSSINSEANNSKTKIDNKNKKTVININQKENRDKELKDLTDIIELKEILEGTKLIEYFELLELIKKTAGSIVFKGKFKTIKSLKFSTLKMISFNKKEIRAQEGTSNQLQNSGLDYFQEDHSEAEIHWKLKNKNIPDLYGYYSVHNIGSCIAMEYSAYRDLGYFRKNILKKHIFSETLLCYISSQALNAILYLHQNKIIHMDVKIGNILIDDYLNVKLCDFSVSINYKSCDKSIILDNNGTIPYKSPEVMEGKRIQVDEASKIDIFSFGVVLFTLGLSYYPYDIKIPKNKEGIKEEDILKNIKDNKLNFGKTKNSEMFQNFVEKCLEKDITKRYNIYQALKNPWIIGNKYILNEKEKLCNASKFLINMTVGNIIDYNKYVNGASASS